MCVFVSVSVSIRVCVYACVCIFMYVHVPICVCVCVCVLEELNKSLVTVAISNKQFCLHTVNSHISRLPTYSGVDVNSLSLIHLPLHY